MKARAAVATLLFAMFPVAATAADFSVTPTNPEIAFGAMSALAPAPPQKSASVLVRSSSPWTLAATLESELGAQLPDIAREQIEIKNVRGEWIPFIAGVPVAIVSGDATPDAGALAAFELRVRPASNSTPGPRRFQLRFAAQGAAAGAATRLTYEILPTTQLDADPRPFESPAVNPARPGIYPYDRHRYIIRSNVPWAVELTVTELKSRGSSIALPPNTLVVVGKKGEVLPIVAGQPLTIEAGEPTASDGLPVEVQLAVRIDDGVLAGGEYTADIKVIAHPVPAGTQSH